MATLENETNKLLAEEDEVLLREVLTHVSPALRGLLGSDEALAVVTADSSPTLQDATREASTAQGILALRVDGADDLVQATADQVEAYEEDRGELPRIVVVPGLVALGAGKDLAEAKQTLETYAAVLAGGDPDLLVDENEGSAEEQAAAPSAHLPGRLEGKVAVITGAAQGFGLGIAQELITQGAQLVLADLNVAGAQEQADLMNKEFGKDRAVALEVNVSDETSTKAFAVEICRIFGGLDLFVSNAGVLRAGSVMDQPVADFDLVTNVNYRGYFLGVQAVAPIMAVQNRVRPNAWFDIIEINSKSGLEGSKRNFAYAGSKFGGIGLTQSFALELVENGIKVNAICPGNYLDGPLWMDPDRGLFVQYLNTGKVPGAKTIEEVRSFYEAKVPMNRGCVPGDLAKAIYYIVDQDYETGQAVPVTGGQNMLS